MAARLQAHDRGTGDYPREELDSYLGLYKKIKDEKAGTVGGNQRFVPHGSEDRSIRLLHELRNDFGHFTPKGWSLDVAGLPRISLDALRLIAFLGWETANIFWHDATARASAKLSHAQLVSHLGAMEDEYDSRVAS